MNAQQLRNSILQEAIEGRLVPQDPNDEPASVLLERIREEKKRLVKEGKLKKKDLEEKPISEDEKPFDIPDSWEWVRIGTIFNHSSGKQLSGSNTEGALREYITTSNLYWGRFELDNLKSMYYKDSELEKCTAKQGDLLVCEGGDIGRSAIWPYDYDICLQNHVHRLKLVFYIIWYYKSVGLIGGKGIGIQGLSASALKHIAIPLPPLAEQERIVAKIEELLPKVEEYGKAQEALDKLNEELPERLKKSILQEAITGRLIPQDPNDKPASVLLERIREEKKRLVKEGQLKKKDLEEKPISEDEKPFEIPKSWEWVRWGTLSESIQYGYNTPAKEKGRIKMVRISDIQNGEIAWTTTPYCDIDEQDIDAYKLKKNDILFARTGGTVGKSYLVSEEPQEAIYAGYLIRTRYSRQLCPQYLKMFMDSSLYWEQLKDGTIATAQPNCNGQKLAKMILPLPPLAEQKRIVAKIEEVFKEIDKLKK